MSKKTTSTIIVCIIVCIIAVVCCVLFASTFKTALFFASWDLARFFSKIIVFLVKAAVIAGIGIGLLCLVLRILKGPSRK